MQSSIQGQGRGDQTAKSRGGGAGAWAGGHRSIQVGKKVYDRAWGSLMDVAIK